MFKTICTLLLTAVLAMEACAGPFTVLRRGVGNNGGSGYSVDTSSAQSVAYYLASTQRVGHYGGNYAFEGVGVAQSATGMFYACCRW